MSKTTFVWDNWMQACPECGNNYLMPLKESVSDENDHRVYCDYCDIVFDIEPVKTE